MKNMTFLSILLLPTTIFAQSDDYCPCMENSNPLINVMNMMSSMDDIGAENFVFQRNAELPNLNFNQEKTPAYSLSKTEESNDLEEATNSSAASETASKAILKTKKLRQKSAKKRHFVRLKARKKVKKYRGKCPSF